jgi:hypothetical protein
LLVVSLFPLVFLFPSHLPFWVATSPLSPGNKAVGVRGLHAGFCHYAYHGRLCFNVELNKICTKFRTLHLGVLSLFSFPSSSS